MIIEFSHSHNPLIHILCKPLAKQHFFSYNSPVFYIEMAAPHHFCTMHYLYILKSLKDSKLYIGQTSDLRKRLAEHNTGQNKSTKHIEKLLSA